MELVPLTVKDKGTFAKFSAASNRSLSSYAFENILIWKPRFEILHFTSKDSLCIFFKDPMGCFMILPPLGRMDMPLITKCFGVMRQVNGDSEVSRIENIEEEELAFFRKNNFRIFEKSKDYIVNSKEMAELKGERFKHKRNLANHFTKSNIFKLRPYSGSDKAGVLELYDSWKRGREEKNKDIIYQAMLEDSRKALSEELECFFDLDFCGYVIEQDSRITAFTSGFPLSKRLFCINFEIADLSFKGISQYIFSYFASQIYKEYPEINVMDDSGIENIRATKLSYKPVRTATSYSALMKS